jgi:hypothetical protein
MTQVMIALSARDDKTTAAVWRLAKRNLNPVVRRRMGWRGRSSFLRQLILYGFERASEDPIAFLKETRDTHDPLVRSKGRAEAGVERREAMVARWETIFPASTTGGRGRRIASKSD